MKLKNWHQSGKHFDYKGLMVFYHLSKNSDETLLCLHGFPTSSFDYHKIWNALSEKFAVLAFDMIGYGFSAKPFDFDYTTFNQTDVLQALIENLKIKKIHILAHDYGNTITLELLARAEEKRLNFTIETICFLNGALFPETHRPILAQKILISPLGFLFGRFISDARFKKSLASIFGKNTQPSDEELEGFLQVFKFNNGRRIAHKLIRYMTERKKYRTRWVSALQQITQPFRFINGLEDKVSGRHLVKKFREVVPHQTDIIELENIGHFPHFEKPEIILEKFFEFHQKDESPH
ncbi:MAG: alpha/beta hydrolase [Acidobacteria bacterium]|nr:alpha/beta hydrolase [Acidobacteriota bacterium]MCA1639851.1 alpha/beta hydrolase [Acidobacteriota bacterium]